MKTTSGSQLFSKKGKPKKFSWGDAALTANISEEKVSLINKKIVSSFYEKFAAPYCAKTILSIHTETQHYIFEYLTAYFVEWIIKKYHNK